MKVNFVIKSKTLLGVKKAQGLVEYALIISFIAIVLVLALGTLHSKLAEFFAWVAQKIANVT